MTGVNVFGQTREDLARYFVAHECKPFRATQLMQWLYHKLQFDFSLMTNFSAVLRREHSQVGDALEVW